MTASGSSPARLTSGAEDEQDPAWSPNSARIAYTVDDGTTKQIWVMNADGTGNTKLTNAANVSENPNWSPNGQRIVFDSDRADAGNLDIYSMRADGSDVQQLTDSPALDALPAQLARRHEGRVRQRPGAEGLAQALRDELERWRGNETHLCERLRLPDGSRLGQLLHGAQGPCTITGTINVDHLLGTSKADVICGLGGNDLIEGFWWQRHAPRRRR